MLEEVHITMSTTTLLNWLDQGKVAWNPNDLGWEVEVVADTEATETEPKCFNPSSDWFSAISNVKSGQLSNSSRKHFLLFSYFQSWVLYLIVLLHHSRPLQLQKERVLFNTDSQPPWPTSGAPWGAKNKLQFESRL